jgi:hypothetical protein
MLKEPPKEGLENLTCIFSVTLRLEYWPKILKIAPIIMIHKPGKNPMEVSFYLTISLLPTISKSLEKLVIKSQ